MARKQLGVTITEETRNELGQALVVGAPAWALGSLMSKAGSSGISKVFFGLVGATFGSIVGAGAAFSLFSAKPGGARYRRQG